MKIIKRKRKEKGMTQSDLGKLLGVSKATIQKYESGEIVNFKAETIKKLSEILDIDVSVLIFGKYDERYNAERLRNEANVLDAVKNLYGEDTIELIYIFSKLSPSDQSKVVDYARLVMNAAH